MRKRIVIVQRRLTHYRVPLFEKMKQYLSERDIELQLLVGQATNEELKKNDQGYLDWAIQIPTRYFLSNRVCWQSYGKFLRNADLVIITQENWQIYNQLLLIMPRTFKLAFWGHGRNLQSKNPAGVKEKYKSWTTKRVDWWFAYTQLSADIVVDEGFPADRITILNNSIDTKELIKLRETITNHEIEQLKKHMDISGRNVGVFIGSLYPQKHLDFLIKAVLKVREAIPDFELIIIGDGPDRKKIQLWTERYSWIYWAGAKKGRDKVLFLSLGDILLHPGAIGLIMLDSFALQMPIITTNCQIHGPEIAYLKNNVNGVITPLDITDYSASIIALVNNRRELNRLKSNCIKYAAEYSIDNMTQRFSDGIVQALTS